MAKKKRNLVRMVSTGGTGVFFVTYKSSKTAEKLVMRKYDKKIRKHVEFKEHKMK